MPRSWNLSARKSNIDTCKKIFRERCGGTIIVARNLFVARAGVKCFDGEVIASVLTFAIPVLIV